MDQLSDQKFEEDSQIHDFESSSFIINNSDFKTKNFQYLQSFPKSNAIISAQPLETEKFLHFIRLTPFEISFLSRKNQDLENPLPLHSLKDIIQDFFYNPILSQDNLRKSAIFLIETLLEKKLSLSQAYSQNEELWETSKSDFLKKNANYKSEQKISSEIKSMLEYFENLLKKAVELSTIFYELLNIVKNYTNNELILKISENKQISIEKVLFLMQNLKNNNHNDKKYTISIRTQTKEVLNNLRVELELFEGQFKSSNQKHKAFFLLIQESYHELFQLQEIFVKRLQILRTHLFSAQSACNLILLPFTSDYHSNNTNLESSYKILKNVEHKLLKFKTKIKQIQIHSSFFQHLKHHIKYNLKLTIQSLEIETDRVLAQTKLLFEFPRIESDIKSLHSHLSIHNYSSNPFSLDFGRKFYCKMVQVRLFSELLRKQTKPLTVLLSFQAFLETNLKILIINYDGCKNQLKERQREELQKIGSLRKEAETCSQKIQIYLEKNLLSPEERYFLKQNVNSLIETFETLSNCTEITDNASSQIVSLKTQLQKDIVSMDCFEEMLKSISLQISFPSLKPLLNGLKISSKINLFNPFLKKLEKYCNHLSPIPSLYRPIKELLARIITLLPCLKYFQSLYEEYVEKFTTFSSDYEALKEEIWNMRPALLAKIASLSSNKEDKSFFISIGEQFIVALKKHYEVLTPENILYLHNESKHMLLEIESRINFFYSNSENLNSMAISNNRQLRLKNTMNLFFHIIDKLKLSNTQSFLEENNLIFIETEEILHRCKGFVNSLLKISQMAVLIIEKGLQPYKQKLGTIERFNCMKEFLNELREGKRGLTLEKTQVIDEQIKSLYIYLLDDIGSLNLYLEKLVPNIEKFIHYKEFFEERKNTFLGDQNFLLNLKGFLNFHRDINNNPNTHKKKLFYENSSINDIIQSTYALWFEEIMTFFTNFNLNWLEKLYICLNILNKNPLKSLMIETIEFVDEFLLKLNSNNDLITLSLFLKERITYFNEKYNNLELSVFTLETLNQRDIGSNIFFTDIELIKEDFKQTPSFYIWSECFENTRKVLDAGERVIENSEKKTFIIWKRAIAKLYFSKLEVFAQSAKLENAQKRFLEGTIEMIKKYFFTVKKKVFSKNMTEILKI